MKTGLNLWVLAAVAGVLACGNAVAQNQTSSSTLAKDSGGADDQLSEVIVTGTLLNNPSIATPTPVQSISDATVLERAPASIADVVNQVPSFRITRTPEGIGRIADQQSGVQSLLDLRGLGAIETLVLIDGKRTIGTNMTGTFDSSMIPVGLIDRVDVVTGGASAAYGSDAVAGVVNFVLKKKMDGITGSVQTGISQYGDGAQNVGTFAAGLPFAGDRGHFIIGVDAAKTNAVGNIYGRSQGAAEPGLLSLTAAQRTALGEPAQVFSNGVEYFATPGGAISTKGSNGNYYAFNSQGTPYVYNAGTVYGSGASATMSGSSANYGYNPNGGFQLESANEREVAYGRAEFDITPNTTAYASVNYGHTRLPPQLTAFLTQQVAIPTSSLPSSIASLYSTPTVNVERIMTEEAGGEQTWQSLNLTRFVVGAEGKLFNDKWNWDVSYERGRVHQSFNTTGLVTSALDAAMNGCNQTATNPNFKSASQAILLTQLADYEALTGKSCVAISPFGKITNAAALNFLYNTQHQDTYMTQDDVSGRLTGSPFSLWAGDVDTAIGAEWRRDTLQVVGTQLGLDNVYSAGNFGGDGGSNTVKEVFAEVGVPLIKDLPFVKALDLNGAVRRTDYQLSGPVTTWKGGATYQPVSGLMFRVTKSRDIRAPNLNDLYFVGGALPGNLTNSIPGTFGYNVTSSSITSGQGNPNLLPEKADTFTTGIVIQPTTGPLSGLRTSVDYYHIRVNGSIARYTTAQTQNECAAIIAAGGTTCPGIVFNTTAGGNGITSLINYSENLNALVSEGIDIELGYHLAHLPLIPGSFDFNALFNHAIHDQQVLTTGTFELAGSMQGVPSWNGNITFGYNLGAFSAQWQLTGFTGVKYDTSTLFNASSTQTYAGLVVDPTQSGYLNTNNNSINLNHFGGMVYSNPSAQYQIGDHLQVFAAINNLFNRMPPEYAMIAATSGSRNLNYDLIGRFYKMGVRFNY